MNLIKRRLCSFILAIFVASILSASFVVKTAQAAPSTWQKGATFFGKSTTDFSSATFKQSVDNYVLTGAKDAALLYHVYQANPTANHLYAGWNTPTDQALADGIKYMHSKGLKVMVVLKPDNLDGTWHAEIDPTDRNTWFADYNAWLLKVGSIAQLNAAERISIGTELYKVASQVYNPDNTIRWLTMIQNLRGVYGGKLTYGSQHSGNRSEKLELGFGTELDYIGISAYFPLTEPGATPEESLYNSWVKIEPELAQVSSLYGKPIIFTEAGYRSLVDAHQDPFSSWRAGAVDEQEQARDYQAMFSFWKDKAYFAGVYIWAWETDPQAGGNTDNLFTPQHKLAEATLCKWYKYDGVSECSTSTDSGSYNGSIAKYTISDSLPSTANIGQTIPSHVYITTDILVRNVIVQAEVFNDKWQKVDYHIFNNQNFDANTQKDLYLDWKPLAAGTYHLKVGIYQYDWAQNYKYVSLDTVTTVVPPDASSARYTITDSLPATSKVGQVVSTHVFISSDIAVNNAVVQAEVFNDKWQKVDYHIFNNQNLGVNVSDLAFTWTPTLAGTYHVKVGVYKADWSQTYTYVSLDNVKTVVSVVSPVKLPLLPLFSVKNDKDHCIKSINNEQKITITKPADKKPITKQPKASNKNHGNRLARFIKAVTRKR